MSTVYIPFRRAGTQSPRLRSRSVAACLRRARDTRSSGFSLVEFLLISVPVMLLTLGGIELAHWFHVRQMVGLALVEAARAGATQHAQPTAIAQAFEQALRPLFAGASPQTTDARLAATMHKRSHAMGNSPPWQIRIVRPDARDFALFATPTLTIARTSGLPAIRNDYQVEQQQRRARAHGGALSVAGDATVLGGTSVLGDATVFQANTLVLRLSYPHPPLLPGVARLLAGLSTHTDAYAQRALAAGLLPMMREVHLDMASHPVDWPSLPDGRVIKGLASDTPWNGSISEPASGSTPEWPIPSDRPCVGLWCPTRAQRPLLPLPESGHVDETGGVSEWGDWGPDIGDADEDGNAQDVPLIDVECP